jgi:hypothetical protein
MSDHQDSGERRPRDNWFWMKDSSGKVSASLTFAALSFMVITLWILLSIFETIQFGEKSIITRPPPSEGIILAYLGTTFSLYFGRRYSVDKLSDGISNVNRSSSNNSQNNSNRNNRNNNNNNSPSRNSGPPPIPSRRNTQAEYVIDDDSNLDDENLGG